MFKNKKKLDSKVRFQRQSFKKQLRQARDYKRETKKLTNRNWEVYLNMLGLGSWKTKVLAIISIAFFVYWIYVPNIFFVKNISVVGNEQKEITGGISRSVRQYFSTHLLWPQRNLLLLSKSALQTYIAKNNTSVLHVAGVSKKFPNTVIVTINPRVENYRLEVPQGMHTLSNDGIVLSQLGDVATSSLLNSLKRIIIASSSSSNITVGQPFMEPESFSGVQELEKTFAESAKTEVDYFSMETPQDPDIAVHAKAGYTVFFDSSTNIPKSLAALKVLLANLPATDIKKLLYIDMRFDNKSYVCYKGTACEKPIIIPTQSPSASTTPTSTPNLVPTN